MDVKDHQSLISPEKVMDLQLNMNIKVSRRRKFNDAVEKSME